MGMGMMGGQGFDAGTYVRTHVCVSTYITDSFHYTDFQLFLMITHLNIYCFFIYLLMFIDLFIYYLFIRYEIICTFFYEVFLLSFYLFLFAGSAYRLERDLLTIRKHVPFGEAEEKRLLGK
jgi:hypothetical protein